VSPLVSGRLHPSLSSGRGRFNTVVFDLDGVLIDSFQVMRKAFITAYREVGGMGEPPFEEYCSHQGRYFPDIMQIMGLPGGMEEPFVQTSHQLIHQVRVYPEVPRLLRELRAANVRTAIATGKSGQRARTVLDVHGLLPLLDTVVGSDEVPRSKPMPDIVQEGLRRLDAQPHSAVMVGDAVIDIQCGRAAGVATVGATWGEGTAEQLCSASPDFVLDRPISVLALVCGSAPEAANEARPVGSVGSPNRRRPTDEAPAKVRLRQ
jgi:AHBA synthesis associated protein